MTVSDIVQIVIGALSLVATVAVSFFIYWLQSRHEKEMKKLDEKHRIEKLSEEANNFLIDHEDERDYLPWCTIATNLHQHERHNRKIYTDFCRCSAELQNKILEMAEFSIRTIEGTDWVDDAFEKLEADIKKYKLGEQPFLYDGAKYFHRAFTYYRENEFNENHNRELKTICKQNLLFVINEKEKDKVSLSSYIEQYFDFVLGTIRKEYIEWDNPIPPVDYAWEYYCLGYAPEEDVCYWIMELVENFVVNIHNRFGTCVYDSVIRENSTDAQAETYEDRYYDILYWMYYTYCYLAKEKESTVPKPKKAKRLKTKKKKQKKEKLKKTVDKS
ncbi:MAG: hypothetical protein J1F71_02010 [Clostridiales bacterium]|nr:hypothetical protein [Clostridiales bacterium]